MEIVTIVTMNKKTAIASRNIKYLFNHVSFFIVHIKFARIPKSLGLGGIASSEFSFKS